MDIISEIDFWNIWFHDNLITILENYIWDQDVIVYDTIKNME